MALGAVAAECGYQRVFLGAALGAQPAGHVDHRGEARGIARRQGSHCRTAGRHADGDDAGGIGVRPLRDRAERRLEVVGVAFEALEERRARACQLHWHWPVGCTEATPHHQHGEPAAAGEIARLLDVILWVLVAHSPLRARLAMRDQRDGQPAGRRGPPDRQRLEPNQLAADSDLQKARVLDQIALRPSRVRDDENEQQHKC